MQHKLRILAALALAGATLAACGDSPSAPDADPGDPRLSFCAESDDECLGPRFPDGSGGGGGGTGTTTPPAASYTYGSYVHEYLIGTGQSATKEVYLTAQSKANANVAQTTVSATFEYDFSCAGVWKSLPSQSRSGSGSPLTLSVGVGQTYAAFVKYAWRVRGVHTFTPVSGATGGGTFSSSWWTCY